MQKSYHNTRRYSNYNSIHAWRRVREYNQRQFSQSS